MVALCWQTNTEAIYARNGLGQPPSRLPLPDPQFANGSVCNASVTGCIAFFCDDTSRLSKACPDGISNFAPNI